MDLEKNTTQWLKQNHCCYIYILHYLACHTGILSYIPDHNQILMTVTSRMKNRELFVYPHVTSYMSWANHSYMHLHSGTLLFCTFSHMYVRIHETGHSPAGHGNSRHETQEKLTTGQGWMYMYVVEDISYYFQGHVVFVPC